MRPREKSFSAPLHYSRLFGGPFPGHDESDLRELSLRMKDVPQNRRGRPRRGDLAPSGLVYLGQFLDHDLTRDDTRLADAAAAPEKTRNFHTPRLDLESVMAADPRTRHIFTILRSGERRLFSWVRPQPSRDNKFRLLGTISLD